MIKRLIVLAFLVCAVDLAWADAPTLQYGCTKVGLPTVWYATLNDASVCEADYTTKRAKTQPGYDHWTYKYINDGGSRYQQICDDKDYCTAGHVDAIVDLGARPSQMMCPGNIAPDTSKPTNEQCPSSCSDVSIYNRKFTYTTGPFIAPTHWGSCSIVDAKLLVCRKDPANGDFCMWQFHRDGNAFTGKDIPGNGGGVGTDTTPDNTALPTTSSPTFSNTASNPKTCTNCIPCPAGSVNMGVDQDGVPLCVGTGTNPTQPAPIPTVTTSPDVTTQNSDGSTTTIGTKTQQNSDGSTTTTTTTTVVKADGTKTVSVGASTGNTSSGSQGQQDTPDSDKNNLCKQNPTLTLCQNSSVSGTCGTVTCTGDAIQCATLRATAAMQCQQKAADDDMKASNEYKLGDAVLSGADPQMGILPDPKKPDSVTMAAPDTSGWLGGGAYFKDTTIALPGGGSMVLPLSWGQQILIGLRYVTMIISSLVCFRMIRDQVKGV